MKQKSLFKGIITLVFLLCICLFPLFANPATAYANSTLEPKLNVKTKSIVKGKDYALKVYNLTETQTVTFSSDDAKVASVDENGVVTALSVGTAVITATVKDSAAAPVKLQCKITVGPPAIYVRLSSEEASMVVGQRATMYWLIYPINTVELPKFFSSSSEVASVSAGGVVTAKSEGTAYIFAQIGSGQYSTCCITVTSEGDAAAEATFEPDISFADFLIRLNEDIANGDNTSENTGADVAQ